MPKFIVRFKLPPHKVTRNGETFFESGRVKAFTAKASNSKDAVGRMKSGGRVISVRKVKN